MFRMVKKHKVAFLTPIVLVLAILAILYLVIGKEMMVVFIYAGV
jgi:hypothetical protein